MKKFLTSTILSVVLLASASSAYATPPGKIVDPVRPVANPNARDHRHSAPPVVRDHRTVETPVTRDHRVQPGTHPSAPSVMNGPYAPNPVRTAPGGVTVTNSPSGNRNSGGQVITGTGPLDGIGSAIVDFFTPDLGEVPPNRDHRTPTGVPNRQVRDHR